MQYRLGLLTLLLVGCGDNIIPESSFDANQRDSALSVDAEPDSLTPPSSCTDSVTAIKPGNPGADPTSYPADGWWSDDTRTNGMVAIDDTIEPPSAFGCTSARFVTGATTASPSQDKAQLISYAKAGVALSTITNIKYWAYRDHTSTGGPAVALALNVFITGASVPGNYASLTYEPYQQAAGQAAIVDDTWQQWNATSTTVGEGTWWTTKIANPAPGSQALPIAWADFQAKYPDAKVLGYGFNLGSFNPNMIVAGDGLEFGTTITDF
ncbi:MAG TPA: hypothetical protein VGM39_25580 [Kofleriaceae bacterium]|jgi:hypothetical protein